jgi:hypothetical protein
MDKIVAFLRLSYVYFEIRKELLDDLNLSLKVEAQLPNQDLRLPFSQSHVDQNLIGHVLIKASCLFNYVLLKLIQKLLQEVPLFGDRLLFATHIIVSGHDGTSRVSGYGCKSHRVLLLFGVLFRLRFFHDL